MLLMRLLDAGTTTHEILQTTRLHADHVENFAEVEAPFRALDVPNFLRLKSEAIHSV